MIELERVTYFYDGSSEKIKAVDDLSLTIEEGQHVAVIGPNGSGKSTLARLLNALLIPKNGRVLVDGIDTRNRDRWWDIRQKVGIVFQNPDNQIVATSVEEDVAFGPENLGLPPEEIALRVNEALSLVRMEHLKDWAPHNLSGGQKQRVAIAGVIAMRPKYLVMDEPTAMLDPQGRKEVLAALDHLKKKGMSIIFITHFMEEAALADRVLVMDKGRIVLDGVPKWVFAQEEILRAINLDLPPITELANELRREGVCLPEGMLHVEELVDELWHLLS
ncbi:MAG TPA: energy-coupling factor transporter ATPase [Peptococcaceae bacterium]|nr:MAG: Cobalt ABC transporter, ATPase subunit [Clostridia bacterium 41_269]HBT20940.1 energy-coupling factor transporter ATPase [Peptococcaceae bacterium]